jgi:hypothetical protein
MSFFNDHLDEQIERDFTKHDWKRVSEGQTAFYERPLSRRTYELMVHLRKVTISKRKKGGMQAMKRFLKPLIYKCYKAYHSHIVFLAKNIEASM